MKALQLTDWKHDAEVRDVPDPTPGPGEVLVRVGGAGACHSDLHLMYDFEPGMLPWGPPFTLGHEVAGWVESMGEGVRGLAVGEPVAVYGPWGCGRCRNCLLGMENYCERQAELRAAGPGLGFDGGMAPFVVVGNPRWLVPIGDLDPVDAAPLTDAGLTPYHAIKRSLPLLVPGSTAIVIGAGGLGHMAIQILQHVCAATVIAVDQRLQALELASHLGAEHVVIAGDSAVAELRDLTAGRGAEVVLDFVGSDATLALGAQTVRPMGHLTIVGIAGGVLPVGFFAVPYEAAVATTYWGTLPELVEVIALARAGSIRAHVRRFSLDEATSAYKSMRDQHLDGRAVIVPAS